MALYFLSDVHLRSDYPERANRLARMISRLGREDRVVIVGDLVDFWYASRERRLGTRVCPGLVSLAEFRDRGGSLTFLPGNHDGQLDAEFSKQFGSGFAGPYLDLVEGGLRIRAIHGHRIGVRSALKAGMESRAFLHLFGLAPNFVARRLDTMLNRSNERHRDQIDGGHLDRFRSYARDHQDVADLFIFGHVHRVIDEPTTPRMIVLGGWHQRSSFLRIDEAGPVLHVEEDR